MQPTVVILQDVLMVIGNATGGIASILMRCLSTASNFVGKVLSMYLRCTSRMHFFLIMEMVEFPYPNCNSLWTHLHMALLESVHYTKHFLNESLRSLRFRFLPMKTNLLVRVSPGAQGLPWPVADDPIPSIMWTPWKTCR